MAFNNNTYTEQLQQMEPLIDRLLETLGDADDVCRVVTDHIRICAAAANKKTPVKQSPPALQEVKRSPTDISKAAGGGKCCASLASEVLPEQKGAC